MLMPFFFLSLELRVLSTKRLAQRIRDMENFAFQLQQEEGGTQNTFNFFFFFFNNLQRDKNSIIY